MQDDDKIPGPAPAAKDAYELDLDSEDPTNVDEILEDALEAVEKRKRDRASEETGSEGGTNPGPVGVDSPSADTQEAREGRSSESAAGAEGEDEDAARLRDRLARTMADFANYRKRTDREKDELRRYAAGEVIRELLGVVDNLERAVGASGSVDELKEGLDLVLRQQADILKRWGVEAVAAVGEAFDPKVHEAVAREESAEVDAPTVTGELQKGYVIHGRLLRPAMVHVTMPATGSASGPTAGAASGSSENTDEQAN